ncbi:hypothetical protein PFLUV_G00092090 [Perca fluviatilis]|uniref:Ribonuclease A-domain domain-containing protein n=1 Tax=Perca fluviatilis TaxID=8168 RepID=A0A6A5EH71_PERFL|nr:hypothetical protein PFLUV_G00092090 [Perca fluviatilis]
MAYDFLLHQGTKMELSQEHRRQLGLGAGVVYQLSQRITEANHMLYFNNYFTTYNLLELLAERKIHAAGTARVSRFARPPLQSDKEMAKKPRGSFDEVLEYRLDAERANIQTEDIQDLLHFKMNVAQCRSSINMKISIFAGVLLISAAVLSVDGQSWAEFQNKHIKEWMTAGQCTQVMRAKRIVNPPTQVNPRISCKTFNTFIITEDVNAVRAICGRGGAPYGNSMRISTATFPIVDCNLVNQNPPAVPYNCRYNGVPRYNRRIIVRCENGEPVHFHRSQ